MNYAVMFPYFLAAITQIAVAASNSISKRVTLGEYETELNKMAEYQYNRETGLYIPANKIRLRALIPSVLTPDSVVARLNRARDDATVYVNALLVLLPLTVTTFTSMAWILIAIPASFVISFLFLSLTRKSQRLSRITGPGGATLALVNVLLALVVFTFANSAD